MELHVKGKNLEVNDSIRGYAERKLGKLERRVHDTTRVELELAVEKNPSIPRLAGRRGDRPPEGADAARARGRDRHEGRDRRARRQARPPGR